MSNKIINSVFDVWSNLENSYERATKKNSNLTKSEFFKSLVGFNNGEHSLPKLLKKLSDSLNSNGSEVDDVTLDKYSKLAETFKILGNYLDNNSIPSEIENLDSFLIKAMGFSEITLTPRDVIDEFNFNPKVDGNINYFYHRIMLEEFGALTEYVTCDKNGDVNHYRGVECPRDSFRYFTKDMVYSYLKDSYSSKEFMENKFNLDSLAVITLLIKLNKVPNNFFVSDMENIKNDKLFGVKEVELINTYSDPSINFKVLEYVYEGMGIFCLS